MKIETANRFAVINNPQNVKVFDVYIDGSFGSDYTSGAEKLSPYGSGWVMTDKDVAEPQLLGYGMTQFWDTYNPSSEVGELRSIVQFFEGMKRHFPHMLNRSHKYHVICDNMNLIHMANKSVTNLDTARSASEKYGKDYARLRSFMAQTNITFEWVKGHATNKFNCFADTMAYKAYRMGHLGHELNTLGRFCFITSLIIKRKLVGEGEREKLKSEMFLIRRKLHAPKISVHQNPQLMERWNQGNTLRIGIASVKSERNNIHQGVVFSKDGGKTTAIGTQVIEDITMSKMALQMRAIQQALFDYRTAEGVDVSTPLTILTNIKSIPPIINSLRKGVIPNTSCAKLVAEIENMKALMTGMTIRAVFDGDITVSEMTHRALEIAHTSATQALPTTVLTAQ
ncbi:MAG: hypothetical protein H9W81_08310 [Enterococcus sp.]|nr:hypothetical protein [Enterococcus sp.]